MNVLNFVQFFRNLSLCDKARVAFNQPQVKGMAGSPSERVTKNTTERLMSTFFFYVCTAFTKDIQWVEKEVYLKEVGWCWGGSERWFMYHAYSNLFALGTTQP